MDLTVRNCGPILPIPSRSDRVLQASAAADRSNPSPARNPRLRENGRSSWFSFTLVLNPAMALDRGRIMDALRKAEIGFRMITGGCFLRHQAIKYFDYDTVGDIVNANIAHDRGFFVGNHPRDLTAELRRLREVLDDAAG